MRWGDERYVRVYTRDTASWLLGPWQARALLPLIMRKLDRAGVLDLGDDGAEAIAVVAHVPVEIVEVGLSWWLQRGTLKLVGGKLTMPNFLDAQEASASDAQRMRESRARARAKAIAEVEGIVTSSSETNDTVTKTNGTVTNGYNQSLCAVPSRTVPSRTEPTKTKTPAAPVPDSKESGLLDQVRTVFDYWASRQAKQTHVEVSRLKLTKERRAKIQARLKDGATVEDIKRGVDGVFATPFNTEKGFTDIELVCRDGAHLDRYMAAARSRVMEHAGVDREISMGKVKEFIRG